MVQKPKGEIDMALKIGQIIVDDVRFNDRAGIFKDGNKKVLGIDPDELIRYLMSTDGRLASVRVHIARPGDKTWLLCVKDVIQPRVKLSGLLGHGRSNALGNVAVVSCGQIVAFQEGIIPMFGPGAEHTPFSKTINVALDISVVKDITPHAHEEAVRLAGLRTAEFLGKLSVDHRADRVFNYNFDLDLTIPEALPRVAYICMLLSQGLLHDNYVLGCDAKDDTVAPCIIPPTMILDGAINSGNCVSACDKNTTWHHQNNPVIEGLFKQHGKTLNFVGAVLTNEPTTLARKISSAKRAAELVDRLGAQIAIITEEGFGNPEADLMEIIRQLDKFGIKSVAVTDEYAGSDGASQSLADTTPEARAVISTGNANELIVLPAPEKIVGPIKNITNLAGAYPQSLREDGSLEVELQAIIGATNQMGFNKLSCRGV